MVPSIAIQRSQPGPQELGAPFPRYMISIGACPGTSGISVPATAKKGAHAKWIASAKNKMARELRIFMPMAGPAGVLSETSTATRRFNDVNA